MLKTACLTLALVGFALAMPRAAQTTASGAYPMTQLFDARAEANGTTVSSVVTIHVDRLMEENRWKRVTDALKFGGYSSFYNTLRPLPAIGKIELKARSVDIKYAREDKNPDGSRLVLASDKPLFFLGETSKSRAGYELTIVELRTDSKGVVTGEMTGAARVKPSPEGGVVLDDFADVRVTLTARKP
jgi:hypothetical protein